MVRRPPRPTRPDPPFPYAPPFRSPCFGLPDRTLNPAIAEIPHPVPLRAGLRLIAGFGPAAGAGLKIARILCQPFILVAVAAHHHQRVPQIDRMVGAEAELAAGLQLRRDQVERAVVHHPPLRVARLGPRVGVEQIGEGEIGGASCRERVWQSVESSWGAVSL